MKDGRGGNKDRTQSIGPQSLQMFNELCEVESIGSGTKVGMYGGGLNQLTPVLEKQEGMFQIDVDGKKYFDLGGSMASGNLGLRPQVVLDAMFEQSKKVAHCPDYPTEPRIQLAKQLTALAPGHLRNNSKVMYDVGGGPMIDLAMKLAYFNNINVKNRARNATLTFLGGYHGRTIYTSLLSGYSSFVDSIPPGQEIVKVPYPYCYRCHFNQEYPACDMQCTKYIRSLFECSHSGWRNEQTQNTMVTTLIVEPFQCHAGGHRPPPEFYPELRKICDDFDVIMIEDGIPTFTFSGHWFGCEHYAEEATPDMLVLAKALTAGMWPLGAVIAKKHLYEKWDDLPDRHYASYMGHPLGCAAAIATIEEVKKKNLLENARKIGEYFLQRLKDFQKKYEVIGEVTGFGLILAVEFVRDKKSKTPSVEVSQAVVREALKRGLIVLGGLGAFGNRHIIHPAITINQEQLDYALEIFDQAIDASLNYV